MKKIGVIASLLLMGNVLFAQSIQEGKQFLNYERYQSAEDVFQKLGDSALFCVMDITKGFWNVPISPESRKYTAFTLRNIGLFEYLVMPMGLKNSPATFARLCELVFPSEDFKEFLQCFLDDLCLFCKDFKALLPTLDKVFATDHLCES